MALELLYALASFGPPYFTCIDSHHTRPVAFIVLNRTETFGQGSPQSADLLFVYGKALLENAVAQSAVLGKDDADAATKEEEDSEWMLLLHQIYGCI
jgi:hypothetical protein